ncbi:MAG: 30S ribosomal protein S1 [Chloroflexota bacterium]|nr:MAG: 30S ribosomal protein S1 [Chloroflexota bacterium]
MDEKNAQNGQKNNVIEVAAPPEEIMDMKTLLEQEGLGLGNLPQRGEIRTGIITTILPQEILVDVQAKADGIIAGYEFDDISKEVRETFKVGDEISVYVVTPEDRNGNVVLSYIKAQTEKDWAKMEALLESGETIETVIDGFNKGGLLVPVGQLRGFVPGSQISVFREEAGKNAKDRWAHLIGEKIILKVIEVERGRKRLVLSERDAIGETRETIKEMLLAELEVGDVVSGYVSSLADFGAFVNIQGIDGLVHISELAWEHVKHPRDVVKVGEEIEVKVISLDKKERRIGLSLRALQADPWMEIVKNITEGQLVQGTVMNITDFGVFAQVEGTELEGLVHISELSEQRIKHPKEVVNVGDTMPLRVTSIDGKRHRIGLSLTKVHDPRYASQDLEMLKAELETEEQTKNNEVQEAEIEAPPDEVESEE